MNFSTSFENYVSVGVEVLPCEVLSVDDIYVVTENKEVSENDEETSFVGVKVPNFSDAIKRLETFCCCIENVENVSEKVFKNFRQLDCFQSQIIEKISK